MMTLGSFLWARPRFSSSLECSCTYDNNIFYLSPGDLTEYRQGLAPARFPFPSADDIDITVISRVAAKFANFFVLKLALTGHQFLVNQEKSYGVIRCQLEQKAGVRGKFLFFFVWLPNYLIRYYREFNRGNYYPCRLGERVIGFDFDYDWPRVNSRLGYALEADNYSKPFAYYNTLAHRIDVRLNWHLSNNFNVTTGYNFKLAQAKGPIPDISYLEHSIKINVSSSPLVFNRLRVDAGYEFTPRRYTTTLLADRYHYQRTDQVQLISVQGNYRFPDFVLFLRFELEWREVASPYQQEIEEVKDYRAHRLTLGCRLPIKDQNRGTKSNKGKGGGR